MIKSLTCVIFILLETKIIAVAQSDSPYEHSQEGPTIIPKQKEIILQNGQNFTITCSGKGPLFLKQQESSEEKFGSFRTELRQEISANPNYETLALDLYNVDQFAVGYYACFNDLVDENATLNNLIEEPSDTEHVSYIYVYVNGSSSLLAPMRETLFTENKSMVLIGCRPTAPDVKVTLSMLHSNKSADFVKFSPKIGFLLKKKKQAYKCNGQRGKETHPDSMRYIDISPLEPTVYGDKEYILGETFSINCTIPYTYKNGVQLNWNYPGTNATGNIRIVSNEHMPGIKMLVYKNITVTNATIDDEGTYFCISTIDDKSKIWEKKLVTPYVNLINYGDKNITAKEGNWLKYFKCLAYPPITSWTLNKDGKLMAANSEKYKITKTRNALSVSMRLTVTDTGNYTLLVSNNECNDSYTFELTVTADPVAQLLPEVVKCLINEPVTLKCVVTGYPLPSVEWDYDNDVINKKNEDVVHESIYNETVAIEVSLKDSTNITCVAGRSRATQTLLVYEVCEGFQIKDSDVTWYPENQYFVKQCVASKYDFTKVHWSRNDEVILDNLTEYTDNKLSHYATLTMDSLALNDAGEFKCIGLRINGSEEVRTINITVAETQLPVIADSVEEKEVAVYRFQPFQLNCYAEAIPLPQIEWKKDDVTLQNLTNIIITTIILSKTAVNSTLEIHQFQENDRGKYVCKATSGESEKYKTFNVVLKDKSMYKTIITVTVVVIIILFAVMMYLIWKIRKERKFKRELKAIGLYFFKNGVPKSINPDLLIDQQAELLPYDEKFEFPFDKLSLGQQLGAGAFGVVYKAEARGIMDAEETTTVAVKMVKKTADNMYIKALASELKIMVHLGKHVNIVNLLGACTKNIARRELIVIVEYCKFGNLHNYLQKHREVFIDQLNESKENQFGKINTGYTCSSGNSGMHSDYFGYNQSQTTDHTFLNNTSNTEKYSRKVSNSGYIKSEPAYESDCSFLRALCTRDLLCWAFQIARGMEYLASRKVLHGDLAARNILLAEDNVVKICDFGLSKSMYKNDEYQKKGDGLLPVKWLAIECMIDRIFSTQSDVWAFGIVLWELFTLAKTPYPNIRLENVLQWLLEGNRLEKPQHADDKLYNVMRSCWEQKPTLRPTFTQLQETLGSFLEDTIRNHYIDLNATYVDSNKRIESQEDYLAMVCAPDYNIMVAPSPHHYINGNVAPTQLQHDAEGYLQMSPTSTPNLLSPRQQGTEFDFEAKKSYKTPKSYGDESELTPMLPMNRLTLVNESESDVESNLSPSSNLCPRIEEESDDVFQNEQNNVNNVEDTSVSATNPIYISFDDNCYGKKSQHSNYVNVPND